MQISTSRRKHVENQRMAAGGCAVRGVLPAADRVQHPHAGRDGAGGGTVACAPPCGRLRRIADRPERLAGGERPAEISAAGRPAVALCVAGFRRRRRTGRSGVLHHGPHLQCMRCFLTQEQRGCLAGEPDRRGPGRFGGQCPAGSASGGRHGPARRGLCGFAG